MGTRGTGRRIDSLSSLAAPAVVVLVVTLVVAGLLMSIAAGSGLVRPTGISTVTGTGTGAHAGIGLDAVATGVSAVLLDVASGAILHEQGASLRLPPASLTKLMTVLIAVEATEAGQASLDDVVTVSPHAASMGAPSWLEAGERHSLGDLLESMMVASANDSAVAVAEHIAGSEQQFVHIMNTKARELGMGDTHFVNATGLPPSGQPEAYTTARDMATLASKCSATQRCWSEPHPQQSLPKAALFIMETTNPLLRAYPGCDGLKTVIPTPQATTDSHGRQRKHAPRVRRHARPQRQSQGCIMRRVDQGLPPCSPPDWRVDCRPAPEYTDYTYSYPRSTEAG